MNRNQWFVLAWSCMVIGIIFIGLDTMNNRCLGNAVNELILDPLESNQLTSADIWCVINAEMYEPFITLSYLLWAVFLICGFLEPKIENKIAKEENTKFVGELANYILQRKNPNKIDKKEMIEFIKNLRQKYPLANDWSEFKKE